MGCRLKSSEGALPVCQAGVPLCPPSLAGLREKKAPNKSKRANAWVSDSREGAYVKTEVKGQAEAR